MNAMLAMLAALTLECGQPGPWKFETSESSDAGRSVTEIRLASPVEAPPPVFSVSFERPQIDMHHVWFPHAEPDRCHLQADRNGNYFSNLAFALPLCVVLNDADGNRVTIANTEALRHIVYKVGVIEAGDRVLFRMTFFTQGDAPMRAYAVKILVDERPVRWDAAAAEATEWIRRENGFEPAAVPAAAYDPLYSTWYGFHKEVTAAAVEDECARAAKLGMKTVILDDGWQTDSDATVSYAKAGDWLPAPTRFPDMAGHVAKVRSLGLKYMVWFALPFVGYDSANFARFEDKLLYRRDALRTGVLDPRFPEVRSFLAETFARAMREWRIDGLKLDFIDAFRIPETGDPAERDGYAGRDIRSLPVAVDVLMKDIRRRVAAVKPEALIEFRQNYVGPAIRQYGNMLRATDCPGDMAGNRMRIAMLRVTSGATPVHADMLEWHPLDTPDNAARPILNALFGVIQYSMVLKDLPPGHLAMVGKWLKFSQDHREALLQGSFTAHHPELCYPVLEGESARERVVVVYSDAAFADLGRLAKPTYLVNATAHDGLVVAIDGVPQRVPVAKSDFVRLPAAPARRRADAAAQPCERTVAMLPDEHWWGEATWWGEKMPFDAQSAVEIDIRRDGYANQYQSLLVSDRGRYVWCDGQTALSVSGGVMRIVSDGEPIALVQAGRTLREAFLAASKAHFPPSGRTPDLTFYSAPQYCTWIELTYRQNERDILAYAQSMLDHGLPPGMLIIDDTWQAGYGDWRFEPSRFRDPKGMVAKLHAMGFKVLLWMCPFVQSDSPAFRLLTTGIDSQTGERRPERGGLLLGADWNHENPMARPASVWWWNGQSALVDFTDPVGRGWYKSECDRLVREFGVDGFKMDGGHLIFYSRGYRSHAGVSSGLQAQAYGMICLDYPACEFRNAFQLAGQPIVERLNDKGHTWPDLRKCVTDLIAGGLLGYSFMCPDMIGGGQWMAFLPGSAFDPELFVRSCQMQALCGMMQFSASPWRVLNPEQQRIVKAAVALRQSFAPRFVELAKACGRTGEPFLRALEYEFPGQGYAKVKDEFMIGDFLLVAPQLEKGATSREVIVPPGVWRSDAGETVVGPKTIEVQTPLPRLPYFVKP